jgi:hypothetical protein
MRRRDQSREHSSHKVDIGNSDGQDALGRQRWKSAWQVSSKAEDNGWHIRMIGRCCPDGQQWRVNVTGVGEDS